MTLTASQADDIILVTAEEAVVEAERGDPRNVIDDCTTITDAIRSQRREGGGQVQGALTSRQWDVTVAALDRQALRALQAGEADVADSYAKVRDTVLAQVAEQLPVHARQSVTARHVLLREEGASAYVVFQPSRRGRYTWSGSTSALDDIGTPSLGTTLNGKVVVAQARAGKVNIEAQVLPRAPKPDQTSWESIGEISKQWASYPYPELVLAVPGQEGTVLGELTTEVWPHVTYRMRLSVNASGHTAEDHLLQMWPDHAAPPVVYKPTA
ncbi:hypothetical protein AB0L00_16645 [Actinoallomurus sp. NPDC052308]|uniref:hypothetical protein n=1 Tax=Actinoallomurus sp. NPDC052308 TaxID=3155530 RepID=UPI0034303A22